MADPLSIAASIAGIVSAGLSIALELNTIVGTVRDAPKELSYVAKQIEHISELLGFTFQLIEDNESLYRQRLVLMLRDIRWQFKIIQDVVKKCVSGNKKLQRLRWLFKSRRVGELMNKLEALKTTMMLTLQIAQLAERETRESRIKDQQIASLRVSAMAVVKRNRRALGSLADGIPPTGRDDYHVVKYEQKAVDMAEWMAITLSAPCVPLSLSGARDIEPSGSSLQHLTEIPRPIPTLRKSGSVIKFSGDEIDVRALDRYGIAWEYGESRRASESDEVVIRPNNGQEELQEYELDMITGTSAVLKIAASLNWTATASPYLTLPVGVVVDRLLQDWTTLTQRQIEHTKEVYAQILESNATSSESASKEADDDKDGWTGGFDIPTGAESDRTGFDTIDSDDDDALDTYTKAFNSSAEREGIPEWLRLEDRMIALLAKMRNQYAEMKADAQDREPFEDSQKTRENDEKAEKLADLEVKLERERDRLAALGEILEKERELFKSNGYLFEIEMEELRTQTKRLLQQRDERFKSQMQEWEEERKELRMQMERLLQQREKELESLMQERAKEREQMRELLSSREQLIENLTSRHRQ